MMKRFFNISQRWKKYTAVLLLLNFLISPLLYSFPDEKCNGVCELESSIHACNDMNNLSEAMNCCDMMEENHNTHSSELNNCQTEISDVHCDFSLVELNQSTYLLPKTIDNKTEFVLLSTINIEETNSVVELTELSLESSFSSSPPIYLMISSFLN